MKFNANVSDLGTRMINTRKVSRRAAWLSLAVAVATTAGLASTANAVTYTWTQNSVATQTWITNANWAGTTVFVDGTSNELAFFADTTTALVNGANKITGSVPASLTANVLTLNGLGAAATAASAITVAGNSTTLTLDGTTPQVNLNGLNGVQLLNYAIGAKISLPVSTLFTGDGTATFDFTNVVSGAGTLSKSGASALTLSGTNTLSGGVTLNAGVLNINSASALGNGTFTIGGGTTINNSATGAISNWNNNAMAWNGDFTFTGTSKLDLGAGAVTMSATRQVTVAAGSLTLRGAISGSSFGLTKAGNGALVLSGANTYTGLTTVNAGTLVLSGSNTALTGGVTLTGGTLSVSTAANLGAPATNVVFDGGTLQITGTSLTDFSGQTVSFNNNKNVTLDISSSANTFTVSQLLNQGSGGFSKNGLGTVIVSNVNTYTGTTTVNGGLLKVTGSLNGTTGTALTFAGTGTLEFNEAAGVNQGMAALTFSAGDGTVKSTYAGSGSSAVSFSSLASRAAGAAGNFVVSGGTNGSTNKFVISGLTAGALIDKGIFFGGNSYATYDSGGFVRDYQSTDTNAVSAAAGATLGVNDVTKNVFMNGAISAQTTASVNTLNITGSYNLALSSSVTNQQLTVNGIMISGSSASTISSSNGSTAGIKAPSGGELVIRTDGSSNLTISTKILVSGASSVTKSGPGTLTLSGGNTFSGGLTVNDGVVSLTGGLSTNAGAAASAVNINNNAMLQIATTAITNFNHLLNVGAAGATLDTSVNLTQLTSAWSGTGVLTKSGAGTLTLGAVNTFGGLNITGGTVISGGAGNFGSGPISISNGSTLKTTGISMDLPNDITFGAGGAVLDPAAGKVLTLSGTLTGTGGVSTAAANTGTVLVTGNNTYAGGTTHNAGTLQFGSNTAFGSGTLTVTGGTLATSDPSLVIANSMVWKGNFAISSDTVGTSGPVTLDAAISNFTLTMGKSLVVGGNITGTSGQNINVTGTSRLVLGGSNDFGTGTITLDTDAHLVFNNTNALQNSKLIIGAGGANISSVPTLTLNNNFTQEWNGKLTLKSAVGLTNILDMGTGAVTIKNNIEISVGSVGNSLTIGGAIGESGGSYGLNKTGTQPLTLSGNISYTGLTQLSAGTLTLSGSNTLASGGVTLTIGTLNINSAAALGTGTFTISAGTIDNTTASPISNSQNNAIAWNGDFGFAGTRDLDLGTGTVTLNASRLVTVTASTLKVGGTITDGANTYNLTKAGLGTLMLSGANSYDGTTTVSAGKIVFAKQSALYGGNAGNWTPTNISVASGAVFGVGVGDAGAGYFDATALDTLRDPTHMGLSAPASGLNAGAILGLDTTNATSGAFTYNSVIGNAGTSGSTGLAKLGAGTLTLGANANTYTGSTTVSAGTLDVAGTINTTANLIVANGAQAFFASGLQNAAASVSIATGGKVTMRETSPNLGGGWPGGAGAAVSVIGSLSLTGTAKLDLYNNDLVINYTGDGSTLFTNINEAVRTGYAGGAWNGSGINSTTAGQLNYFTLLVLDTADGNDNYQPGSGGPTVGATSVVVKFTHQDDLDGNGSVDATDKGIFTSHWSDGVTGATHRFGDMDFDGVYTFNDVQLFNLYYNVALPSLPEPGSLALLALGAAGLLARKRR